jgi:hypothetical protein
LKKNPPHGGNLENHKKPKTAMKRSSIFGFRRLLSRYFFFLLLATMVGNGLQLGLSSGLRAAESETGTYEALRQQFLHPDHATYGEVPLWWWEGAPMTKEQITRQLEKLAAKGVKAVCPIQRSPGRCDPQSFEPEWWELLAHTHKECQRLGMQLWAYDQLGYGHYGWLEKASAKVQDPKTSRIEFLKQIVEGGETVELDLPAGELIAARAYPIVDGIARDEASQDLSGAISGQKLRWSAAAGRWQLGVSVAVPTPEFYLSETSTDTFIDMLYGELERTVGKEAMGKSLAGVFQDEHPPTPRDVYTRELAGKFLERCGYPIGRALPAQHFDVGPLTPKYRIDFFDTYLELVEATYWKKIYDWTNERGVLTSHDNWGRNNILVQSEGYIDYFRSQRWFSAPGYDDAYEHPVDRRNYYDTKIASSIARLYQRPRVWNEAFHSSGWGRTTEQTLSWLTAGMAFGANLYNEHGLYYATNASTWEHAAPDPHWRQPYWTFYQTLSDWVARTSALMSQGTHVVDAAVHYPVVNVLAEYREEPKDQAERVARMKESNRYMALSRSLYDAGIDNDIFDDDSCLAGKVKNGTIHMGGNAYQALVFGPADAIRRSVVEQARELVESGGSVLFTGKLPRNSVEAGRDDPELRALLTELLGAYPDEASGIISRQSQRGGFCAFLPAADEAELPALVTQHIDRDFLADQAGLYVTHRRIGETHLYLLQNILPEPLDLSARLRVDGAPEFWDAFDGSIQPVESYTRKDGYTWIQHTLKGNTAHLLVLRADASAPRSKTSDAGKPTFKALSGDWDFSVEPTCDNRWGDFRWPPSDAWIGPEIRKFLYLDGRAAPEPEPAWFEADFDDSSWAEVLYSTGPYWLAATPAADNGAAVQASLTALSGLTIGSRSQAGDETLNWQPVEFSKSIGQAKAAPWGGHSGYPDGHIDRKFIQLPEGRKLLFTRLQSPQDQRLGLRIELNNENARLWVNGTEQPIEDAVGNLPLDQGVNEVLLDLPNGEAGRLYVQATPPSVSSMAEAAAPRPQPDLKKASWIWSGNTGACYVRKTFELDDQPEYARLAVTAFSGYRLFINGVKIEDEIGPWTKWQTPESFNITDALKPGKNVIAIWAQHFRGIDENKGEDASKFRGIVLALRGEAADGKPFEVFTDDSWKGSTEQVEAWDQLHFDDSAWADAKVKGAMGDPPWGVDVAANIASPSSPKRALSVSLDSPYLSCFDEAPDIIYDVKPVSNNHIGYYRFQAPPGLKTLRLGRQARTWVNGQEVPVVDGVATIPSPPKSVSQVLLQLEMASGAYAGAAFPQPIGLELEGGHIQAGPWTDYALPTYSGIGVYRQQLDVNRDELNRRAILDLGEVCVAAEVKVNGKSAGIRLATPFEFDLSPHLQEGQNEIQVRVANTIAPHYTTIPALHLGPTKSGLIGPVRLRME